MAKGNSGGELILEEKRLLLKKLADFLGIEIAFVSIPDLLCPSPELSLPSGQDSSK